LDKKRNPAGWKSTQVNPFSAYEKGEKQLGSTNHKKALKKMKSPPLQNPMASVNHTKIIPGWERCFQEKYAGAAVKSAM